MTCKICGRPSAAGAKLCADCRAARKRAYDATITQPLLALAGAGTVSRTLSRLRRSEASPEAKARRAARKAEAAAKAAALPATAPATAASSAKSRSLLWVLLTIGIVLAGVAGWYLPNRPPATSEGGDASITTPAPLEQRATSPQTGPANASPTASAPASATLPPLPAIVERELVPYSPAPGKPTGAKRVIAAPKAVPPPEAQAEVEIVRAPPQPPPAPAPKAVPRIDPWQQMAEAIGRCPEGFLGRMVCEQRVRLQYCEGHWGQVPQCPGGPNVDHN